ncbi:hypothetical protein Q4I30_004133 [Leishmania utingensis]|uniref:Integral membrane protein n=1 Tax=Leishmania utingensis TaxID=653362 RepID=A0AAW3AIB0_9TRYP
MDVAMTLHSRAIGALRRHQDMALSACALTLMLCVCVPLLVVLPESRPYGGTFIVWTLAFAVRAWRYLPRERAHVFRAAHRLADSRMRQCGVGKVLVPYTESSHLLLRTSCNKGNRLPSSPSTEATLWCRGFLAIGSRSSTPAGRELVGMEDNAITDNSSGNASGAAATSAPSSSDLFLSASALGSSAQFLALAHTVSRQEASWPVASRHTAFATSSRSRSSSGRRASLRSPKPFAHVPCGCVAAATTLTEHSSDVPSVEPASLLSMPPSANFSSRTHCCTGNKMASASLSQTPVAGGDVEFLVWHPAGPKCASLDSDAAFSVHATVGSGSVSLAGGYTVPTDVRGDGAVFLEPLAITADHGAELDTAVAASPLSGSGP